MRLQVVLTVGEILLLVLVLAYFLRMLTKLLTQVGDTLQNVADGVRAIEGHCRIIGPGTTRSTGCWARRPPTRSRRRRPPRPSPPDRGGVPAAPHRRDQPPWSPVCMFGMASSARSWASTPVDDRWSDVPTGCWLRPLVPRSVRPGSLPSRPTISSPPVVTLPPHAEGRFGGLVRHVALADGVLVGGAGGGARSWIGLRQLSLDGLGAGRCRLGIAGALVRSS